MKEANDLVYREGIFSILFRHNSYWIYKNKDNNKQRYVGHFRDIGNHKWIVSEATKENWSDLPDGLKTIILLMTGT